MYIFNRGQVSIPAAFDFKTSRLIDLESKHQPYRGEDYAQGVLQSGSTTSAVQYDSVADVVVMRLCIKKGEGSSMSLGKTCVGLAIYDPETNEWSQTPVALAESAQDRGCWNTCYSPELNVHVFHIAGDSKTNGRVVLYRHKRAR